MSAAVGTVQGGQYRRDGVCSSGDSTGGTVSAAVGQQCLQQWGQFRRDSVCSSGDSTGGTVFTVAGTVQDGQYPQRRGQQCLQQQGQYRRHGVHSSRDRENQ